MSDTARFAVLIADELSPRANEILRAHPEIDVVSQLGLKGDELIKAINDRKVRALAVRSATKVTSAVFEACPSLEVVGRAGIGVDNIDVKAASRRGVIVMNTPSGNAVTTAEHAIALLVSMARRVPQATASMKAGKWEKKKFQGTELMDKTLGVLGLGNIGRIVADRAQGLKMKVIASDPVLTEEMAKRMGVELVAFDEVLRRADFITVHTPLLPETKNLIGAAAFAKMKDGVFLINAARGGIVDEAALAVAIQSGKVAGAAFDVFVEEPPAKDGTAAALLALDQVIATPHLGASTDEAQEKVAVELAEQIVAFLLRGEVKNAVNLPPLSREQQTRLSPYVDLATRLGALAAQMCTGVESIDVELVGDIAEGGGGAAIAACAVAGLLRPHLDVPVTQVNAMMLAAERGIRVSSTLRAQGTHFTSSIALRLDGKNVKTKIVKGTIFQTDAGPEPRIVQIDAFTLEAIPEGRILVIRNEDKPGVIGAIGTLLGKRGLNVSRMQVGLDKAKGEALQLWNIEGDAAAALDEVRALAHVRSALVVTL